MKRTIPYLPLFLNLTGKRCLVVGGGAVALRKVKQLLEAQARVTIVAPEVEPELAELIQAKRCSWRKGEYQRQEAAAYRLVVAAVNDARVNRLVFEDCEQLGLPVNVVDQPELCSVIFPAIVRRGMTTIAVSTAGQAPFFTRFLRQRLEFFLENLYWLDKPELIVAFRDWVRSRVREDKIKAKMMDRFLNCPREQWAAWRVENPPLELWESWIQEAGEE